MYLDKFQMNKEYVTNDVFMGKLEAFGKQKTIAAWFNLVLIAYKNFVIQ